MAKRLALRSGEGVCTICDQSGVSRPATVRYQKGWSIIDACAEHECQASLDVESGDPVLGVSNENILNTPALGFWRG